MYKILFLLPCDIETDAVPLTGVCCASTPDVEGIGNVFSSRASTLEPFR